MHVLKHHLARNLLIVSVAIVLALGGFVASAHLIHAKSQIRHAASDDNASMVVQTVSGVVAPAPNGNDQTVLSLNAQCPAGDTLVGGGYYDGGPFGLLSIAASYPSALDTWTVVADNNDPTSSYGFTAYANCLVTTSNLGMQIASSAPVPLMYDFDPYVSAACGSNEIVTAGGFTIIPPDPGSYPEANVNSSFPAGNGWDIGVEAADISDGQMVQAFALCAEADTLSTTISSQSVMTSSTLACPDGSLLTDGGFNNGGDLSILFGSYPSDLNDSAWTVAEDDFSGGSGTEYVVCVQFPTISISPLANTTLNEGNTYSANGSFTDTTDGATDWTATVGYGDGSGTQPLALTGMTFALSHVYTTSGVYTVEAMVTDNLGVTGSAMATVTVTAPAVITTIIPGGAFVTTGMRVPFSFTVTTTGSPVPSLSETGALPTGITFTDNGDGTATLAGEAAAGTNGSYPLTITATNGVGLPATLSFTLVVTTNSSAPTVTSSSSDTETFGVPFTFTVTTNGYPVPTLSKTGTLPAGVTFVDNGDGTATISGTPSATALGVYTLTLKAKNLVSTATQSFTLTIVKTPVFKSVTIPVGHVGSAYSLTLKTSAYNTASLSITSGVLPAGLGFVDNGNGTATISGTPQPGSGGAYPIVVTATNQGGSSTDAITIKIDEAPTITSGSSTSATVGQSFSFTVTATGYPAPSITKSGTLPKGLTYQNSTHTISGTPAASSPGTYVIVFTAKNSSGSVQQTFTLTVS